MATQQEAIRATNLKIARVNAELKARTDELSVLSRLTAQKSTELADLTAQRVQAEDESKSAQRLLQICQEELGELKSERKEQRDKLDSLSDDLYELQAQQTQLRETQELLDQRIHRWDVQMVAFDSEVNTMEVEISALQLLLARHEANEASAPNVMQSVFSKNSDETLLYVTKKQSI